MKRKRDKATVRLNLYIDKANMMAVDEERYLRIAAGVPRGEVTLSGLINEAIADMFGPKRQRRKQ